MRLLQYLTLWAIGATLLVPGYTRGAVTFGSTLKEYVEKLYNWSIGLGLSLAIIMIVYAGYVMIISAGDPQKVGGAKEIIVGALTGVALLAGAGLILNVLTR